MADKWGKTPPEGSKANFGKYMKRMAKFLNTKDAQKKEKAMADFIKARNAREGK